MLKWIRAILNLLKWSRWRKRAKDAESKVILIEETHDAETRIRREGDAVERGRGKDDDLLG